MKSRSRGPRGSYAKTATRRREIIAAAVNVFAASGFRSGSLRDVAERAGMTHAGVMHHFPTKISLLQAVLAWRDEDAMERARASSPSGVEVLRQWLDEVKRNEQTPVLVDLAMTLTAEGTSPEQPLHDYTVHRYVTVVEFLTRTFQVAQEEGHLHKAVDCEHEARILLALTEGLQLQWLLDRDSVDMADHLRRHLQSVVAVDL